MPQGVTVGALETQPDNLRLPSIAAVGTGYWGKNLCRNFSALGALRVVCDKDEKVGKAMVDAYAGVRYCSNLDDVLNDTEVDAIAVATPAATHASLVERALESGKDVYVEKPLCLSVTEGRALVALARERNRILMVGHLLWYHPAVLKLKQLVDDGVLGKIQYVYSNRLNLGKIRREENILWSFAPHDISVILGLLGEMPDTVDAFGGNYLHRHVSDVTVSVLSFPSGVKAHIFVSWLHPFKEQKLVVVGDRCMAVFNDIEKKDKLTIFPHTIDWKNQLPVVNKAEGEVVPIATEEPLREECRHFLKCVQTREQPRTDGNEGLRVLKVLDQCQRALEPGGPLVANATFFRHESAFIDDDVVIGDGTKIWHVSHIMKGSRVGSGCNIGQNVVVGPNAKIGDRVKIQNNVSVYEGVTLEDDVFCGPSVVFTNVFNPRSEVPRKTEYLKTIVKRGATIGANATVVCGITIGQYSLIGAGAVVIRNVPDFARVVGNPSRVIGWSCRCGETIVLVPDNDQGECSACHRRYLKKNGQLEEA